MGVDAEMLVKVPCGNFTQDDTIRLSYELASTIGASHFFITRGDPESMLKDRTAIDLVDATSQDYLEDYPDLAGKVAYFQDGDPVVAADDEQFLRVNFFGRYYGENYARGNWPVIRSTVEWFWLHLPTAEVWYGGDSSGICLELMTPDRVKQINDFFLTSGRKSYVRYSDSGFDRVTGHAAPRCGCSGVSMTSTGGGRDRTFWYCDGCNAKVITSSKRPDGVRLTRHEDVFQGSNRLQAAGLI